MDPAVSNIDDNSCDYHVQYPGEKLVDRVHAVYSTNGSGLRELWSMGNQPANSENKDRHRFDGDCCSRFIFLPDTICLSCDHHWRGARYIIEVSVATKRRRPQVESGVVQLFPLGWCVDFCCRTWRSHQSTTCKAFRKLLSKRKS